ncbi:MAG: hypothetical protein ABI748_01655 [Dokdonella sp.]
MKSAPTIAFDYRPSRAVGIAGALLCVAAGVAPWLSALPLYACAGCSLAVIAWGGRALKQFWNPGFCRIAYRASGWVLLDVNATEHAAVLESHAHLGVLIVLGFRTGSRSRLRVVLTPDNLDAQPRRRLVLMLARAEIVHVA